MLLHTPPSSITTPAANLAPLAALQPERVAVFRALQLGDMLCAVPALRALRRTLPQAHITLIGLPWARDLAQRIPHYVDDFIAFPGFPGLPERVPDIAAWPGFLADAQARRFDLVIQMHGDGTRTNPLAALLGAQHLAGFGKADAPAPGLEGVFLPYPDEGAEPRRMLRLMDFLGADTRDERLEFPLRPEDDAEWAPYPAVRALRPGSYLCVHAGARAAERRWPVAHFAHVADTLAHESGLSVVLTGSEQEAGLIAELASAMRTPAVQAAAPVSAGALAALISRSRLLVSNDTGTSHLASALGVPSVIVFRASSIERWAPLDRQRHRVIWDPQGTQPQQVLDEARALLAEPPYADAA